MFAPFFFFFFFFFRCCFLRFIQTEDDVPNDQSLWSKIQKLKDESLADSARFLLKEKEGRKRVLSRDISLTSEQLQVMEDTGENEARATHSASSAVMRNKKQKAAAKEAQLSKGRRQLAAARAAQGRAAVDQAVLDRGRQAAVEEEADGQDCDFQKLSPRAARRDVHVQEPERPEPRPPGSARRRRVAARESRPVALRRPQSVFRLDPLHHQAAGVQRVRHGV
jgi:hypothetical protein